MPTVTDIIEAFDRREFTQVEQFIKDLQIARDGNVPYAPTEPQTKQAEIDRAFPYLQDISNGPLTNGINTLDGTAKVISGTPIAGINMFNTYNFAYKPQQFQQADDESGVILTVDTLGMSNYFKAMRTINRVEFDSFKQFIIKVFRMVKSGGFDKNVMSNSIKIRCKKIIKISINYRQVV